jgi:hypothetical protein
MPEIVDIQLSDLLIDTRNARLKTEQPTQQSALLAIAAQQGGRLIKLAADIVDNGLDPTTLAAVVPTPDQKKRYIVIEGNRRIVALKALETPSLVAPALDSAGQKRLNTLSRRYAQKPFALVKCVLFESEAEAAHWITLRHTGQNEGIGLVEWGADEKDRYAARHGRRSPAGQIFDFLEKHGESIEAANTPRKGIITSLTRLINTPKVREQLGIELTGGDVLSWFPAAEIAKALTRIVEDLKAKRVKVGDIYYEQDRISYAHSLAPKDLPDSATRYDSPKLLADTGDITPGSKKSSRRPKAGKKQKKSDRTALIPKACQLNISPPRVNAIYNELLTLSVDLYPNACSVALRVFVELSVDHHIEQYSLMTEKDRRSTHLAKRLRIVAADLGGKGRISSQLETAIQKVADSQFILAASTMTFNQYVHNQYVFPKATELKVAWDELQPFMEKLWP